MSNGYRILLVENEPGTAKLIKLLLEGAKYEVLHTTHGRIALDMAAQEQPALIILDVHLPEMNGWEFLKLLKARRLDSIPVLVMSADITAEQDAEHFAICAYMHKPFMPEALIATIAQCIGAR